LEFLALVKLRDDDFRGKLDVGEAFCDVCFDHIRAMVRLIDALLCKTSSQLQNHPNSLSSRSEGGCQQLFHDPYCLLAMG